MPVINLIHTIAGVCGSALTIWAVAKPLVKKAQGTLNGYRETLDKAMAQLEAQEQVIKRQEKKIETHESQIDAIQKSLTLIESGVRRLLFCKLETECERIISEEMISMEDHKRVVELYKAYEKLGTEDTYLESVYKAATALPRKGA